MAQNKQQQELSWWLLSTIENIKFENIKKP